MENNLNDKKLEEAVALLSNAKFEIMQLRKKNEILGVKVGVFEDMMLLLKTQPNYERVGMSPDLVWELEKFVNSNVK